jgi:ribosome-binding factor A
MSSLRLQRVRELLKREIGEVIRREIPVGEAGLITVNDVNLSGDLRLATVYLGVLGNDEQRKKGLHLLEHHRKRIRGLVGHAVVLKYTPELRFVLDDSAGQAGKVLKIIDELEHSAPAHDDTHEDH